MVILGNCRIHHNWITVLLTSIHVILRTTRDRQHQTPQGSKHKQYPWEVKEIACTIQETFQCSTFLLAVVAVRVSAGAHEVSLETFFALSFVTPVQTLCSFRSNLCQAVFRLSKDSCQILLNAVRSFTKCQTKRSSGLCFPVHRHVLVLHEAKNEGLVPDFHVNPATFLEFFGDRLDGKPWPDHRQKTSHYVKVCSRYRRTSASQCWWNSSS